MFFGLLVLLLGAAFVLLWRSESGPPDPKPVAQEQRAVEEEPPDLRGERPLTIIHTNDIHGQVVETEARWLDTDDPPMAGGMARLGTFLKEERERAHHHDRPVLYLDAGDWFSGTPESDRLDGIPMIEGFNAVELDYTTLGNHDVDHGLDTLIQRLEELEAEVLVANLSYEQNGETVPFPGTEPWTVVQRDGLRIGLFGLIYDDTPGIALAENVEGLIFKDEVQSAREAVEHLRRQDPDLIVGITHVGLERDRQLAEKVEGIDVIVGGHTHTRLDEPERRNNTIIAQAGGNLTSVGRLDLTLSSPDREIQRYSGGPVTLYDYRYQPDPGVDRILEPLLDDVRKQLNEVIGRTSRPITRARETSSPLGNLITDVMREAGDADVAFQNAGGIRDNLPGGEVTLRHVHRVLPFGNHLVTVDLTGEQIRAILEDSLRYPDSRIQLSGIEVSADPEAERGERVRDVRFNGDPLEPDQIYRVATSNFLAGGGDEYNVFRRGTNREDHTGVLLRNLLEQYFREHSPVEPPVQDRYRPADVREPTRNRSDEGSPSGASVAS